jgi:catechol 2,3-dioxygenase-like lactoylglutathione lyase family enzyme
MGVDMLQHVNIRVRDLEASKAFYVRAVGLREGPRPPVASVGSWMYLGDQPVIHLVHLPSDLAAVAAGSGAVDHIAFRGIDFESAKRRFASLGIPFREALIPRDGTRQLFVHDPDGVKIELNFDPAQA